MKINNCPKCGGKPSIVVVGDNKDLFVWKCSVCDFIPVKNNDAKFTIIGSLKLWNEKLKNEENEYE